MTPLPSWSDSRSRELSGWRSPATDPRYRDVVTVARLDAAFLRRALDPRGLDEDKGATARLRSVAWVSLIAIVLVTVLSIDFAEAVWMALPGFVWLNAGILTIASGASVALLGQEAHGQNSRGLSILAATYGYLLVVYPAFFLSFPGAITPDGPLLGGPQSSVWLYFAAHFGTLVGIGISCAVRIRDRRQRWWDVPLGILLGVVASAWAIGRQQTLPVLIDNGVPNRLYDALSVVVVILGLAAAGMALLSALRVQSRLRWWLLVVIALATADVLIHMFATARWQVAWYVPRIFATLTGAVLMVVLFAEVLAQSRSMTALRVRERLLDAAELQKDAETDPLTGCLNRRGLTAQFAALKQAAHLLGPTYTAVYFVDLDNFKNINDEYSHEVGDTALRVVAQALRKSVRGSDLVARYGGDEFVVVVQGLRAPSDADRAAKTFVAAIAQAPTESLPANLVVTASVGYVVTESPTDLEAAIREADVLMQHAKREGKNRYRRGEYASSSHRT